MKIVNLKRTKLDGFDKKGRPREHYKFSLLLEGFYFNGFIYMRESGRVVGPRYDRNGLKLRVVRGFGKRWEELIKQVELAVKFYTGELENPGTWEDLCALCKHERYRHSSNGKCTGTLARACSRKCREFHEALSLEQMVRMSGKPKYAYIPRKYEAEYARVEQILSHK